MEEGHSNLPEGVREHTLLVYDGKSGDIVHGHKEVILPDGKDPSPEELERQALEWAAQATDRDASSLKALPVKPDELEVGQAYRVNPDSGSLERASGERSA